MKEYYVSGYGPSNHCDGNTKSLIKGEIMDAKVKRAVEDRLRTGLLGDEVTRGMEYVFYNMVIFSKCYMVTVRLKNKELLRIELIEHMSQGDQIRFLTYVDTGVLTCDGKLFDLSTHVDKFKLIEKIAQGSSITFKKQYYYYTSWWLPGDDDECPTGMYHSRMVSSLSPKEFLANVLTNTEFMGEYKIKQFETDEELNEYWEKQQECPPNTSGKNDKC